MKLMKSMALMAVGAGMVCAYNMYSEPMKKMLKKKIEKTADTMDKLEEMI